MHATGILFFVPQKELTESSLSEHLFIDIL